MAALLGTADGVTVWGQDTPIIMGPSSSSSAQANDRIRMTSMPPFAGGDGDPRIIGASHHAIRETTHDEPAFTGERVRARAWSTVMTGADGRGRLVSI